MIRKIKSLLLKVTAAALLLAPVAVPTAAYAQIEGGLNCGSNFEISGASSDSDCEAPAGAGTKLDDIIKLAINVFSLVVGVIAVVMIIIGGLKYITSGGDSGNITGAKNTILYAIVGLVVVALAQFIVHFVLEKASGAGSTGN